MEPVIPKPIVYLIESGKLEEATRFIQDPKTPSGLRWAVTHGFWAMLDEGKDKDEFGNWRFGALAEKFSRFSIADIVDNVQCKVFVGDAEEDMFFAGQPKEVAAALGQSATYGLFKTEDGAGEHCQDGAVELLAQTTMDWFGKVIMS
jgi:hypothetical protein